MIKINVVVKDKSWLKFLKKPEYYLKQKISKIKDDRLFKKKNCYAFSLSLSNSKEIKALNKKFRKKNKPTDILSFPNQTKNELKKLLSNNSSIYLGDIIINFDKINPITNKNFKAHLDSLWVHGLVHLFGYDHKSENSYKKMKLIENKLLKKIN